MSFRFFVIASLALVIGCGDDSPEKTGPTNNATAPNAMNASSPNTLPNNDDCNTRLCVGQQLGDGWTVVHYDFTYNYTDMWIESADDIWLATQDGRVRRGSGTTWVDYEVPGSESVTSVEGDGNGNVWVTAYPGGIYRFDDGEFVAETIVDAPDPERGFTELSHDPDTGEMFANSQWFGIWTRRGEQWEFVAQSTGLLHNITNCGGTRWFATNSYVTSIEGDRAVIWGLPTTAGIDGATRLGSGEVIGAGDEVLYYDGDYKRVARGNDSLSLDNVAGTSLDDLWGFYNGFSESFVYRYDGRDWREIAKYDRQNRIRAIYTDTPGQLRVFFQKTTSAVLDTEGNEISFAGSAPGTLTLGGEYAVHFLSMDDFISNGYRWTPETEWESINGLSSGGISIWAASPDDVWGLGESGRINRFEAGDQRSLDPGFDVSEDLNIIRGSDTGNVWAAGWDQVVQWDGTGWIDHSGFDSGREDNRIDRDVALVARDDEAWVWRGRQLFHFDGDAWAYVQPDPRISRVGCEDDDLVAISTDSPAILRGGPTGWTSESNISDNAVGVASAWMTDTTDAWFLTRDFPGVRYWDGQAWVASIDNPMTLTLRIQELPDGTVYIMGQDALFLRPQ